MPYQRDVSGTDGVADKAHMAPKVTLSMDDGLEVVLLRTSGEIMDSMHHLFGEYVASAATLSENATSILLRDFVTMSWISKMLPVYDFDIEEEV